MAAHLKIVSLNFWKLKRDHSEGRQCLLLILFVTTQRSIPRIVLSSYFEFFFSPILTASLCRSRNEFFLCLQNVVALVMIVVRWCIPDMSGLLRDQIRREAYITNEIIIQQETMRARGCAAGEGAGSGEGERSPCAEWGHLTRSELDLAMLAHHELEIANAVQRRSAGAAYSSDHPVLV
jgi:hypothetical protein